MLLRRRFLSALRVKDRGAAVNEFLGILSPAPQSPATGLDDSVRESDIQDQAFESTAPMSETARILLTNSHMLATLIDVLCEKKILTKEDVRVLLDSGGDTVTEERA